MQKQILRNLTKYVKVLNNGTKVKRNFSISSALMQNEKGYNEGQQPSTRSYSLAVAAQNVINCEACEYQYIWS